MREFRRKLCTTVGAIFGLALVQIWTGAALAQVGEPNYQIRCFTVEPPVHQVMSPGLNRGTAEGEWNLCQAIIDGAALDEADAVDSTLGNNMAAHRPATVASVANREPGTGTNKDNPDSNAAVA